MEKVVYINYQPITSKYYYDYYLDKCIDNGFEVEYWDVSKWFFPEVDFHSDIDYKNVKYVKSKSEIVNYLSRQDIKSTFFITNITYEYRVLKLFFVFTSFNCTLGFFARGMYPMPESKVSSKFVKLFSSFDFKIIGAALKNKWSVILKKYKIVKVYDFVFRAGSDGGITIGFGNYLDLKNAKITEINYFDYDKYLNVVTDNIIEEANYCVFMDQYLAYHPDIALCGLKNVNPEVYYSELNNFFDYIEKKYNLTVVVAAHPKAVGYKTDNPFCGRKIIFGKTCELVKESKFVLTHHSTAISYPILFNKPIVFLNSKELKRAMPDLYDLTGFLGGYLNSEVIFFDEFDQKYEMDLFVDFDIYDNYKYKFLTSKQSEDRLSSDIFIQTLRSL